MSKYPRVNIHTSGEVVITLVRKTEDALGQIVRHCLGQSRPVISKTGEDFFIGEARIPITKNEAEAFTTKFDKIF